jgi:hypothetical protein
MPDHINGAVAIPPTCGICQHFKRYVAGQPHGCCHRHAPVPLIKGFLPPQLQGQLPRPLVDGYWPPTNETEACGEWSAGPPYLKQPLPQVDFAEVLSGVEAEGSA